MPLDALIGILLEYSLAVSHLKELGIERPDRLLERQAGASTHVVRIAPTPELRHWITMLTGALSHDKHADELPELVLSERLIAMLPHGDELTSALDLDTVDVAVAAEIEAAKCGLTLHSWTLSVAIATRVPSTQ